MNDTVQPPVAAATLPSIDDAAPTDEGGAIARIGFNYQDEIAAGLLVEMLGKPTLLRVHCETHDDIVVIWSTADPTLNAVEFVQVKGGEPDKLWSVADLCQRKKAAPGTSIFEQSLCRDRHLESATFRIITLRPVVSDLKMLTYPRQSPGRAPTEADFVALLAQLEQRCPGVKSAKDHGAAHWLERCHWDPRDSERAVRDANLLGLIRLSAQEGRTLLPEQAEAILRDLRDMAKAAGAAKWKPDAKKKMICRDSLRAWWEQRFEQMQSGVSVASGGKLAIKMKEANLSQAPIDLASEMRRLYAAEARTPRYMQADEAEQMRRRVLAEAMSLQAELVAGDLALDGEQFHALCLQRMDAINAARAPGAEDHRALVHGCMYDITDRCFLRFVKSSP
ncbi:MAG: DUF4297 domain-containing protein [Gammaproteobacteria bacterium]|nr:DUF4297 domain-containing protein [Gammaproteobacteria bacterium]